MQRWLKRAGLILFFGLWAAAGLQIWAKKQESREMEAVVAFSNIGTDNRSGIVQYYGKLKKEKQVQMLERREEYLRQIAASLGISSQILVYRTYGEDSQSVVLQKEGAILPPDETARAKMGRPCQGAGPWEADALRGIHTSG